MSEHSHGSTNSIPRVELRAGITIPRLIVGCWQLAARHGAEFRREDVVERLFELAQAGLDTFDGADIYTGVEELLGELRRRAAGTSVGSRIRVHTKVVPDLHTLPTLRRRDVEAIVDRSLRRLGSEALDLVQFHWWDFGVPGWMEAAGWLGELRDTGKVRDVGVTNFDAGRLRALLDAGIPVVSNQVQYSLLDRRPSGALTDLCRERGIHLLCYGTLAGGFLTERWLGAEEPAESLENRSLVKYRLIVDEAGNWAELQGLLRALRTVARRHEVGIAEVASRWVLDRAGVAALVTGVSRQRRADQYRATLALRLDEEDRQLLSEAVASLRPVPGEVYGLEREPGGRHAAILQTDLHRGEGTEGRGT